MYRKIQQHLTSFVDMHNQIKLGILKATMIISCCVFRKDDTFIEYEVAAFRRLVQWKTIIPHARFHVYIDRSCSVEFVNSLKHLKDSLTLFICDIKDSRYLAVIRLLSLDYEDDDVMIIDIHDSPHERYMRHALVPRAASLTVSVWNGHNIDAGFIFRRAKNNHLSPISPYVYSTLHKPYSYQMDSIINGFKYSACCDELTVMFWLSANHIDWTDRSSKNVSVLPRTLNPCLRPINGYRGSYKDVPSLKYALREFENRTIKFDQECGRQIDNSCVMSYTDNMRNKQRSRRDTKGRTVSTGVSKPPQSSTRHKANRLRTHS